jgi:hypothetical protein
VQAGSGHFRDRGRRGEPTPAGRSPTSSRSDIGRVGRTSSQGPHIATGAAPAPPPKPSPTQTPPPAVTETAGTKTLATVFISKAFLQISGRALAAGYPCLQTRRSRSGNHFSRKSSPRA